MEAFTDQELIDTFKLMHERIYQVYDLEPDRDLVYDLLAQSFTGRALTTQYIEHYTTLVRMEHDETSIMVLSVDYDRVEVISREGDQVELEAEWSVGGVVTHQGHKHPRVNKYAAVYTIGLSNGDPRITGTHMKNLERVRRELVEGGWSLDAQPKTAGGFMSPSDLLRGGFLDTGEEE